MKLLRTLALPFAVAALLFALTSCGGSSSDGSNSGSGGSASTTAAKTSGSSDGSSDEVKISDFAFDPKEIEVHVGDTVHFANEDSATHTATSKSGAPKAFDTGKLKKGDDGTVTFDEPGDYEYQCSIHEYMTGTVRVLE